MKSAAQCEMMTKYTHFPPVFKNAVEILFIDFACVVIKAGEEKKRQLTCIHRASTPSVL